MDVMIKKKIKKNGDLHIPKAIMKKLKFKIGDEVILRLEGNRLIVESENSKRKKLKIKQEIVDELVENEDFFTPEAI